MDQHGISLLRKIIFPAMLILTLIVSLGRVNPVFAQDAPDSFEVMGDYIRTTLVSEGIANS